MSHRSGSRPTTRRTPWWLTRRSPSTTCAPETSPPPATTPGSADRAGHTGRSHRGRYSDPAAADGSVQGVRAGPGAQRRQPRCPGRCGHRAGRGQRGRQGHPDQVHLPHQSTRCRDHLLEGHRGQGREPDRGQRPRHPDRGPGPRPVRQARQRAEQVPTLGPAQRGGDGARCCADPERAGRDHGPIGAPAGGVALRRAATVRGDRQGRAVAVRSGDHGRADRRPRCGTDQDGPGPGAHAGRAWSSGAARLAQPARRVRGGRPDRRHAAGAPRRRALSRPDEPGDRRRPDDQRGDQPQRGGRAMSTHTAPAHPTDRTDPAVQLGVRVYVHLAWQRIRGGETGILPVLGGFILVSIIFQILDQQYLTAGNLINLLVQSAVFMLLGMAEVLVLLLGEIDLSVGFVAGVSAVVLAWLAQPQVGWPWWATILAALVVTALIGLLQGSLVTRIGLPSFVVTLGGLLFWNGVMLFVLGSGGAILIRDHVLVQISSGTLSRPVGWIVMDVLVALWAVVMWRRDARRRSSSLPAPPLALTITKIVVAFAGGAGLILLANADRGIRAPVYGLPWVALVVLAVLLVWSFLLRSEEHTSE